MFFVKNVQYSLIFFTIESEESIATSSRMI